MRHSHVRPRTFSRDIRPNISGTAPGVRVTENNEQTGVFSISTSNAVVVGGGTYSLKYLLFDANKDNDLFGKSPTFQPFSGYALIIIKV